jgi:hypothetical protein
MEAISLLSACHWPFRYVVQEELGKIKPKRLNATAVGGASSHSFPAAIPENRRLK